MRTPTDRDALQEKKEMKESEGAVDRMEFRGTTVLAVKKGSSVAMAADGQVTLGNTIMKGNAKKVRKIYDGKIIVTLYWRKYNA